MAEHIYGKSANDVWKQSMNRLLLEEREVQGRSGNAYELLHAFITIENPRQKWIYSRRPPMSIAFALAELVWIMNGDNRSDIINYWNANLAKFAGQGDYYHGAYGNRIRVHFGFDQLERAYMVLQNNGETRQIVIQIYDTKIDFPHENGNPRDADIPCNICSLLKLRNRKLEWSQIMRSNDIYLGMPYNFIQYTGLQEVLAGWLGVELGSYNHYSDSLHLYSRDIGKISVEQDKHLFNTDNLSLPKGESDRIFPEIYSRMKSLALGKNDEKNIYTLSDLGSHFEAYDNMMRIITAYAAQKQGYMELANNVLEACTNNMYIEMWNNWMERRIEKQMRSEQYE